MELDIYNPEHAPNPDTWLEMSEFDRIDLVQGFLENNELEIPEEAKKIHALIHIVVENQVAIAVEPVPATMARLIRQGLTRHDAIHAIGTILAGDMFEVMKSGAKPWNQQHYIKRLNKLTAKRWRQGK